MWHVNGEASSTLPRALGQADFTTIRGLGAQRLGRVLLWVRGHMREGLSSPPIAQSHHPALVLQDPAAPPSLLAVISSEQEFMGIGYEAGPQ